jgi:hypothetical protein
MSTRTPATEALRSLGIWIPGDRIKGPNHAKLAFTFWGTVFGWTATTTCMAEKQERRDQVLSMLKELDSSYYPVFRIYFSTRYYYSSDENKARIRRFFQSLEDRVNFLKMKWFVVKTERGHKGFHWGNEIPNEPYIVTPQSRKAKAGGKKSSPKPKTPQQESKRTDGDDPSGLF